MSPEEQLSLKALRVHTWLAYILRNGQFSSIPQAESAIWPNRIYEGGNTRAKILDGYAKQMPHSPRSSRLHELDQQVPGSRNWFIRPLWSLLSHQIQDSSLLSFGRYARKEMGLYAERGLDAVSQKALFKLFWQAEELDDLEGLLLTTKIALRRGHYEIACEAQVATWGQLIKLTLTTPLEESRLLESLAKALLPSLETLTMVGFLSSLPADTGAPFIRRLVSQLRSVEDGILESVENSRRNPNIVRRSVWYQIFYLTGLKERFLSTEQSNLHAFIKAGYNYQLEPSFRYYCQAQEIFKYVKTAK